jgi:general nucleoside transport system permease protein
MSSLFTLPVLLSVIYSGIRLATPYLYAALGETLSERGGVLNLGMEGMMLMGAFCAYFAAFATGNLWLGLLAGAIAGLMMGLIMAVGSITFHANQGISGIGLYMFGSGLSSFLYSVSPYRAKAIEGFPAIKIPLLGDIPYVGEVLFQHNILVYGAYLLVPIAWFVLNKTVFGLKVRAVGQNPKTADSLGVNVANIRYSVVCLAGILGGIAGASLSISILNIFQEDMTAGMGFIVVALVYFGGWRPVGVLLGALLFSFINAFQGWIQVKGINISPNLSVALPYIVTIVTLAFAAKRSRVPAALTKPFERGEN